MRKEVYLVVISVLEGKNFPKRTKHQLIVESKFDGELLSTDPIDHVESPDFTTELAWELDKKALHQHRMQRTPIKLQCFAINVTSGVREQIGYVLLDLRLAQLKPLNPKWYNLLSSKYSRLQPAIKVGVALEDDCSMQESSFKARDAPPRPGELSIKPTASDLVAMLDENEGHFQIGPPENCHDFFVLSVTIAFAAKLEQLVPSDKKIVSNDTGYFFYYTLFGNDVTGEPFPDLLNPDFVPERASVRIRTSLNILQAYLAAQDTIPIHLCSGDQSLGNADIPLDGLLKEGSREVDAEPMIIDGAFTLYPPNIVKQQLEGNMQAKVGVSVCLKREAISDSLQPRVLCDISHNRDSGPQDIPERDMDNGSVQQARNQAGALKPKETLIQSPRIEKKPSTFETDDEADSIRLDSHANPIEPEKTKALKSIPDIKESVSESTNLTTTATHPVIPPEARHYRFSLHLKSIVNIELPFACNAFLRYSYPFFGSAAPVLTSPPVEISKRIETKLPQSLCTFDFACTPPLLHNTFNSLPLVIELWHRGKESNDALIATASLPLSLIMMQEPARFVISSEDARARKEGTRLSYSAKLEMKSIQKLSKKVADLNASLNLEDLGPVRSQKMLLAEEQSSEQVVNKQSGRPRQTVEYEANKQSGRPRQTAEYEANKQSGRPRQTAEYEAALELELWKERQEEDFENRLKEKETEHMRSLAEEWQRRDRERESLINKRIVEYNRLEAKLRKSLAEVDVREKQLASHELELSRIRKDVQMEHERALAQAKEAACRMKEDCVHQVQLERSRVRVLEDEKTKLKSQLMDAEKKFAALENKFQDFKIDQSNMPEVRLQSELQLITLEKSELERKLESVNKSKLHYKQQWGRALKELARLKQREQEHALANLKRQQDELEQMRMRHVVSEEREANRQGQKEILEIKDQLNRLKSKEELSENRHNSIMIDRNTRDLVQPELMTTTNHVDEHVSRLIEERDTLLRTGVYSREDRIIVELDRQIRDAISRKSSAL